MNAWESVQNVLNYIEGHYEEDINIDTLSAVSHLSKFYFQRLFYKLVNKNAMEYIKLRRLAISLKLLKESDEGILDIALNCGFKSHSSFSSAFKEVYGITPDYYRKRHQLGYPGGHFRHGGRPEHLWPDGCRGQAAGSV